MKLRVFQFSFISLALYKIKITIKHKNTIMKNILKKCPKFAIKNNKTNPNIISLKKFTNKLLIKEIISHTLTLFFINYTTKG